MTPAGAARIATNPHYVYKAFDSFGLLLYVGCSVDVAARRVAHRRTDWDRYSETLAIFGPWDRAEARRRETAAINAEAPYFNSSFADNGRTKANTHAAIRALADRGWSRPALPEGWQTKPADFAAWEDEMDAWHRAHELERARLKESTHPYLTDRDRLARYLVARHDAALAMAEQESAA